MLTARIALGVLSLLLALPLSAQAAQKASETAAPIDKGDKVDARAAELLGAYRKALGTPEALARCATVAMHGKERWQGIDEPGFLSEIYGGLGRFRSASEFSVFGQVVLAATGEFMWEIEPLGIKVREGWDASQYIRLFAIAQHVPWTEMYERARYAGTEEVRGRTCHVLNLHPRPLVPLPEGDRADVPPPDRWFLDAETNLLARVEAKSVGILGEATLMRVETDDYRETEGVLFPYWCQVEVSGFRLSVEYESIEPGVEPPADAFVPLPEVLAERERVASGEAQTEDEKIVVEEVDERHVASIRLTCDHADLQKTLSVLLPEVMHHVLSVGARMDGPPLVRYHSFGDTVDLEAGIPLEEPIEPKGRVKPETLPGGRALIAWHVGPYEELGTTHARIDAYLAEHGLARAGACWEEYWTDPGMEPDSSKWRTRIVQPVREAEGE